MNPFLIGNPFLVGFCYGTAGAMTFNLGAYALGYWWLRELA